MPWSISVYRAPRVRIGRSNSTITYIGLNYQKSTWTLSKDSRGRWYSQAIDIAPPAVLSRGKSQIRSTEHSASPRACYHREGSHYQQTSCTMAKEPSYISPLRNLVLLIEDKRVGQTMNHQSVDLDVILSEMANPEKGIWADAKEVCERLQESLSRIDGKPLLAKSRAVEE